MAPAVWEGDFPDPFVLEVDGVYLAFGTNAAGRNVQLLTSTDLATWSLRPDALPRLPRWAQAGHTWAPAVLAGPAGYVMYYTVRDSRWGRQAISVATSEGAAGPFRDGSRKPLIFQRKLGGSIDPSPFVDADGRGYLLWKADSNAVGKTTTLWGQELSADRTALIGTPARLLEGDAPWEQPLIEAPCLTRHLDQFYLFYSANWWNTPHYGIGYAIGPTPLGPFVKQTVEAPWLSSGADAAGPGGQEFFLDAGGALRMAFHAWAPERVGYPAGARALRIASVTFVGGRPVCA